MQVYDAQWAVFVNWVAKNEAKYQELLAQVESKHGILPLGQLVDKAFEQWKVDNV